MNIYHKINSIRKQLRLLEQKQQKETARYKNKYGSTKYQEMPFKPGTMQVAEHNLMQLSGTIRELRQDLNRLVFQEGNQEVIDWYYETEAQL